MMARTAVTVVGQPELIGRPVHVPGDPSSAALSAGGGVDRPGAPR